MQNIPSKIHKAIVRYAVFASPITLFYIYWFCGHSQQPPEHGLLGFVGYCAFAWVLSLLYVTLALLFNDGYREALLTRLAGFKESDEREREVTAHAARATFLLMLAVQIVMLIMTLTTVQVSMAPRHSPDDKPGMLSVGLSAGAENLDVHTASANLPTPDPDVFWAWGGHVLPANMTLPMLLLVLLQLGAFRLFSGRHYEGAEG